MRMIRALPVLVGLAIGAVVVWSRLRRHEDPWRDELDEDRDLVAVPVAVGAGAVAVGAGAVAVGASPSGQGPVPAGQGSSGPAGRAIKAKESSGLYHTPASPSWERMHADAWFESEADAEAAGFKRWDWRRRGS